MKILVLSDEPDPDLGETEGWGDGYGWSDGIGGVRWNND